MGKPKKKPQVARSPGSLVDPSEATENHEPRMAFLWATAFERAAMGIKGITLKSLQSGTQGESAFALVIPWVVNGAFAAELYLKTLHLIDSKSAPFGHDLLLLFDGLSIQRKVRLEKSYKLHTAAMRGKTDPDLRLMLAAQKSAFPEWRYAFQATDWRMTYSELTFCIIARSKIIQLRPEWLTLTAGLQT